MDVPMSLYRDIKFIELGMHCTLYSVIATLSLIDCEHFNRQLTTWPVAFWKAGRRVSERHCFCRKCLSVHMLDIGISLSLLECL